LTTLTATVSSNFACLLSESQLSDDDKYLKMTCDKVFQSGSWIFSGSGWNRPHDVLAYQMSWPEPPRSVVTDSNRFLAWIVKQLVPKITKCLRQNNAIDVDKGTALLDAEFLIASHGHIFLIDSGFGVTPVKDFFISGSGGKLALGALSALQITNTKSKWQTNHDQLSKVAIEQAVRFDFYSSGPIRGYKSYPSGVVEYVEFS
jgi:hypothetical protein